MLEWLRNNRVFLENEKYELIVRVHPAELRGTVPSNQKWWMKSTKNLKNFLKI